MTAAAAARRVASAFGAGRGRVLFAILALYLSPPVAAVSSLDELRAAHTDAPEPGRGGGGGGGGGRRRRRRVEAVANHSFWRTFAEPASGGAMVAAEFDKLGLDGAHSQTRYCPRAFKPLDAASRDGKDQSRDQSMRARLDRIPKPFSAPLHFVVPAPAGTQHNPPPAKTAGLQMAYEASTWA